MPSFSMKVGDDPVLFSELNRRGRKREEFTTPQSTTNQKSKDCVVPAASAEHENAEVLGG